MKKLILYICGLSQISFVCVCVTMLLIDINKNSQINKCKFASK